MKESGNQHIIANKTTLYCKTSVQNNLLYIKDILTTVNSLKELTTINNEFETKLNFLDYLKIRQSIPR